MSLSRMWQNDAPTPTEEKQWKKQVTFDVEEELGDDPTLPPGLTLLRQGAWSIISLFGHDQRVR